MMRMTQRPVFRMAEQDLAARFVIFRFIKKHVFLKNTNFFSISQIIFQNGWTRSGGQTAISRMPRGSLFRLSLNNYNYNHNQHSTILLIFHWMIFRYIPGYNFSDIFKRLMTCILDDDHPKPLCLAL